MPGTAMAYGSEYGQDSRQQPQSFGGYNTAATMMYNVAQPGAQNPVYDAQQFGSRQPAAMQMMTPDVASTYFGSETGSTGGPGLQQSAQGSSGSANVYQQSNAMNYASNMSSVGAMPQATASADVSMAEDHEKRIRDIAERHQLAVVSAEHQGRTTWLTKTAGLNLDDTNLHADRIKLWDDFNHAWLGLGQRQMELMTSSQPSRSQSLMSKAMIKKMGNELIRLCDGIERHGLVDYQYGVWEEQITAGMPKTLLTKARPRDG
ncbi:hypothetical protein LRP88_05929 [Fusarium phalaenopsidis]